MMQAVDAVLAKDISVIVKETMIRVLMEGQWFFHLHQHKLQIQHPAQQHQENHRIFQIKLVCLSATDHWGWEAVLVQFLQFNRQQLLLPAVLLVVVVLKVAVLLVVVAVLIWLLVLLVHLVKHNNQHRHRHRPHYHHQTCHRLTQLHPCRFQMVQ